MARTSLSFVAVAIWLAACTSPSDLVQVRDDARLFGAEARTEAEIRLRALTEEHGIIAYVLTHPDPDPPRVMDDPMADAEERSLPAVALIFSPERFVALGQSRHFEILEFSVPSAADGMLAGGRADAALELIVDHLAAWMRNP